MKRTRRVPLRTLIVAAAITALTATACTDSSTGSKEAFCEQVKKVPSLDSVLTSAESADPAVASQQREAAREAYEKLSDDAPSVLREDTEEVVALVTEILDAVEANPDDSATAAGEVRKAVAEHPDIEPARSAVTNYANDQCGVALG